MRLTARRTWLGSTPDEEEEEEDRGAAVGGGVYVASKSTIAKVVLGNRPVSGSDIHIISSSSSSSSGSRFWALVDAEEEQESWKSQPSAPMPSKFEAVRPGV